MSQQNVEIVRRAWERLNTGDIDGFIDSCGADIELRDLHELPGSGVFIGHDALRGWYATVVDAFDDLLFEVEAFTDTDGDRVLLRGRATGKGRGSGAEVELPTFTVITLSDEKMTRIATYSDPADALEAAGMPE